MRKFNSAPLHTKYGVVHYMCWDCLDEYIYRDDPKCPICRDVLPVEELKNKLREMNRAANRIRNENQGVYYDLNMEVALDMNQLNDHNDPRRNLGSMMCTFGKGVVKYVLMGIVIAVGAPIVVAFKILYYVFRLVCCILSCLCCCSCCN